VQGGVPSRGAERRPRRAESRLAGLVLVAALFAVGGCGSSKTGSSASSDSGSAAGCPVTAIMRPLSNTAAFVPGQPRRPDNVTFYGVISEATAKCDKTGDTLRLALDVLLVGERGPAGKTDQADLDYFVAVTGPGQSILDKKPFHVQIRVPPGEKRAGVTDHIEEVIPLAGHAIADLGVAIGFQQSPEVVDFYKHFRGR